VKPITERLAPAFARLAPAFARLAPAFARLVPGDSFQFQFHFIKPKQFKNKTNQHIFNCLQLKQNTKRRERKKSDDKNGIDIQILYWK